MPRKAAPKKSPSRSSSNAGKKPTSNHAARRAPDHEQELTGLLKLIKPELTDRRGWMALRYSLLYCGVGGRFYGLPADIRVAAVRILDALRLLHPDYFPDYLRELDVLTDEQLEGAYPADHEIWKLDLSCFSGIDWAVLDLKKLGKLLARCIKINFKCVSCYVKERGSLLKSRKSVLLQHDYPWRYLKRALECMESYSHLALPATTVPGWGQQCQRNWLEASDRQPEDEQLSGSQAPSFYRLVQIEPSLVADTCVEGGRRVKI